LIIFGDTKSLIQKMDREIKKYDNICKHGRKKYYCRNCGTGYCQHGGPKSHCRYCKPLLAKLRNEKICAEESDRNQLSLENQQSSCA
jgi:hypothetical protein